MTVFTKTAESIFAPYESNGSPREIAPQDAQIWGTELESSVSALVLSTNAAVVKGTLAELNAVVANYPVGDIGIAVTDPVEANRGVYKRTATGWVKQADLPSDVAKLAAEQAAANAIVSGEAREAAEAAAALAAGLAGDIVAQGNVPVYTSRVSFSALSIPAGQLRAYLASYQSPGDGGGHNVRRVASEPAHGAKVRTVDRFLPNGATDATNGGWWTIDEPTTVTLQMVGGKDDGSTDNDDAAAALVAAYPGGADLDLPQIGTGVYKFSDAVSFGALTLNPHTEAVTLSLTQYLGDTKMRRQVKLYYPDGIYSDHADPSYRAPAAQKPFWLSPNDYDGLRLVPLAANADLAHAKVLWDAGDTWVDDTPGGAVSDRITWSLSIDSYFHGSFIPGVPGDELSVSFPSADDFLRCAIIRCTGGYQIIYAAQDGSVTLVEKQTGLPAVTTTLNWQAKATHKTYSMIYAECSLRVIDQQRWNFAVSGMPVFRTPKSALGDIEWIGFGAFATSASPVSAPVYGWTLKRGGWMGNGQSFVLGIIGDSASSPQFGAWAYYAREALEFHRGLRCTGVDNRAVGGHTSAQQLAALEAAGLGGTAIWVIAPLINDIQQGIPIGDVGVSGSSVDNVYKIINFIRTNGGECLVADPTLWYDWAAVVAAGGPVGYGPETFNYEQGAAYRLAERRLCQQNGIRFIDTQRMLGQVQAGFVVGDQRIVDPVNKDKIHPTVLANRVRAVHIANGVGDFLAPEPSKRISAQQLSSQFILNGWSALGGFGANYSRDDEGVAHFYGAIGGTAAADAVSRLKFPRYLAPIKKCLIPIYTSAGMARLDVEVDGTTSLTGASAATWISMSGWSWQTGFKD